jgi:hypothetical protein
MTKLLAAALLASTTLVSAASAATVDWNFQDHPGLLGNSQTFSAGGLDITARGFTLGDAGTALFVKNDGGDENGIGLHNDPTGDNEIAFGKGFVQINLDGILGKLLQNGFSFQMGSTTQGEGWAVYGSQDTSPFSMTLLAMSSGGNDEGFHSLAGGWDNYNFFYMGPQNGVGGANVLLTNLDATLAAVPIPPALALFAGGLFGLGALKRFTARKRDTITS